MRVEVSKRAQRSIERIDARWRKHADYPDIFMDEMDAAIEHLETVSNPGTPCNSPKRPALKRMQLEKTKCHLYFVVIEQKQWIELLQVLPGPSAFCPGTRRPGDHRLLGLTGRRGGIQTTTEARRRGGHAKSRNRRNTVFSMGFRAPARGATSAQSHFAAGR